MSVCFTVTYSVRWSNIDLLWCPSLLSVAVSPLFIVLIPSATPIWDNKESNLPSAHWRQHIGLILTGKCGARATEQCNWRGSCSRSGSRLRARRAQFTDKRHSESDLEVFLLNFVPFFSFLFFSHSASSRCRVPVFVSHVCRISLPSWSHLPTISKATFFSCREFIMSCFSIPIIPLNTLQADSDLCQPTCQIFIQPLRRSIIHCCRG